MAFVYRYRLPKSGRVVYIGKTNGAHIAALGARITAHAHEEKFMRREPVRGFIVEYIDRLSPAEADIVETALIATLDPELNSAKKNWGHADIVRLDDLRWKPWPPNADRHEAPPDSEDLPPCPGPYVCSRCGKRQIPGSHGEAGAFRLYVSWARGSQTLFAGVACDDCMDRLELLLEDFRRPLTRYMTANEKEEDEDV